MSQQRWELTSLGTIPHEVLSILLGSLPKVPDEDSQLKSASHDDRLSEDEEDEEDTTRTGLILNHSQESSADRSIEDTPEPRTSEGDQRPWNVPEDEWDWSDEESTQQRSTPGTKASSTLKSTSPSEAFGQANPQNDHQGRVSKATPSGQRPGTFKGSGGSSHESHPVSSSALASDSHPLSVAQDLCVSVCDSGRFIACASKKMFAILQRNEGRRSPSLGSPSQRMSQEQGSPKSCQGWTLIGQGSGIDNSQDAITTLLCLPLYVPRSNQSQVYLVVGYRSGMIRIFNETGHLVVIQQLHHTPVVSIKARIGAGRVPGEDEDEMTILHEGGKVVCIEGESLWVVLRLSNGSSRLNDNKAVQASQAPSFAYKKWSLQNQDLLVDVVSCGPARRKPTLSNGFSSSSSSSMYTSQATERFVSVGSKPMLAFYASSSSGRPLFSATSLATQMAARVTSAVFGFAKSIWGSSSRPGSPALGGSAGMASPEQMRLSGQTTQEGAMGPYGNIYPSAMAPATEVPAVLWLSDSQRCIRHVSLAPAPPRGSCYHYPSKLAAMTDSLGRVLLVDLEECEIIRMWKGLRGARCGWIQEEKLVKSYKPRSTPQDGQQLQEQGQENEAQTPTVRRHLMLYLVIYAPKRGTAEVYPARQGKRVGLLQVGMGWKVCTTFTAPIGKPAVLSRIPATSGNLAPSTRDVDRESGVSSQWPSPLSPTSAPTSLTLAQCLLIGPSGEVRQIQSRQTDSPPTSSPASAATPPESGSLTVSPTLPAAQFDSIANRLGRLSVP